MLQRLQRHAEAKGLNSSRIHHGRSYHLIEKVLPERTVWSDGKHPSMERHSIQKDEKLQMERELGFISVKRYHHISILSYLSTEKPFRRELCCLMRTIPSSWLIFNLYKDCISAENNSFALHRLYYFKKFTNIGN